MRIFFRFRSPQLRFARHRNHLAQCLLQIVVIKQHTRNLIFGIVLSECVITQPQFFHALQRKILLGQGTRNLPAAICPEIGIQNHIALGHQPLITLQAAKRHHKLIRYARLVFLFNRSDGIKRFFSDARNK